MGKPKGRLAPAPSIKVVFVTENLLSESTLFGGFKQLQKGEHDFARFWDGGYLKQINEGEPPRSPKPSPNLAKTGEQRDF